MASVNNLCWWWIEINLTDKSSPASTFWPSALADYAQGCSSILIPWCRTHFEFANLVLQRKIFRPQNLTLKFHLTKDACKSRHICSLAYISSSTDGPTTLWVIVFIRCNFQRNHQRKMKIGKWAFFCQFLICSATVFWWCLIHLVDEGYMLPWWLDLWSEDWGSLCFHPTIAP